MASSDEDTKKKKSDNFGPLDPILSVHVGEDVISNNNQVLYDLQFIQSNNGEHFLVASGDPGIVIYKWADFEAAIDAKLNEEDAGPFYSMSTKKPKCQDPLRSNSDLSKIRPLSTLTPHPSPATSFGECIEINSISYEKTNDILYGASGDVFGCYQWDLSTERLLGTFGGASRYEVGGHRDYLHVVKSIPEGCGGSPTQCVITGGEDGNVGFWDGKSRKLIEMINVQSAMDKHKDSVTSDTTTTHNNRSFLSNASTPSNNLWVSSMDTAGNWLAVCGGAEHTNNTMITSRSSGQPSSSGFMTLWHLPTRTFTSGCVTRESLNTVVYNSSLDSFVSGGNEGRVSFWETAAMTRSGRSWSTPPATYTMSVDPESSWMVVGGTGGTLDCFVDRVKVSRLQVTS